MTNRRATKSDERPVNSLSEDDFNDLIVRIVNGTRGHPNLSRGAGVRGTIALKEVAKGFADISGFLNQNVIEKAALVTLPHRIVIKPGIESSPEDLIKSIIKNVLLTRKIKELSDKSKITRLSEEDSQKILQSFLETDLSLHDEEAGWSPDDLEFALLSLRDKKALEAFMNTSEPIPSDKLELFNELNKELEDKGLIEMTESYRYVLTEEAVKKLSNVLKDRLEQGEITKEEYEEAIARLEQMLELGKKKHELPENEIPVVLADVMDVQDKFATPISTDKMYVHYLLKKNDGEEVDPEKTDYHELQVLIHKLFRKGLLKEAKTEANAHVKSFILTETAFVWLLDDMIKKIYRKGWVKANIIKARTDSERVGIRKYKLGDMFRDLSIRQTFRQLARQQRKLKDIKKSDFKSFVRQPRSRLSITLCIDVSHSMGEESKIRFAKISAATLAKEAIEEGDKVAIITFSNYGEVIMPLSDKTSSITDSVMTLKACQYTNMGDGIKCARELLLRRNDANQKHIIVLTDGEPTAASRGAIKKISMDERRLLGEEYAIEEAKKTISKDIKISVLFIASGREDGKMFAEKLAKIGKGTIYKVTTAEDLPISMLKIWQQAKNL